MQLTRQKISRRSSVPWQRTTGLLLEERRERNGQDDEGLDPYQEKNETDLFQQFAANPCLSALLMFDAASIMDRLRQEVLLQ
jgi:hypothetical protein